MIKHNHESRNIGAELSSVNIPESFSKCMGAVVSLDAGFFAPELNQVIDVWHRKTRITLSRLKQRLCIKGVSQITRRTYTGGV
jgi:hypothetical protein